MWPWIQREVNSFFCQRQNTVGRSPVLHTLPNEADRKVSFGLANSADCAEAPGAELSWNHNVSPTGEKLRFSVLVLGVPPLRGVAVLPAGSEILSGPVAASGSSRSDRPIFDR